MWALHVETIIKDLWSLQCAEIIRTPLEEFFGVNNVLFTENGICDRTLLHVHVDLYQNSIETHAFLFLKIRYG